MRFLVPFALTACVAQAPSKVPPILLYAGTGTSANDISAVEKILVSRHLGYTAVTARQLNGMSETQLMAYQLLVVPGGDFIAIAKSMTPRTTGTIHNAVQGGLNYLGICAGAFLASDAPYNSFKLTPGVQFGFYGAERRGIRKAAIAIATVGAAPMEHYWEDGPELTGWGAVVGRYPDGTPAIVEGWLGSGWVILAGVHPEAPDAWRRGMAFSWS